MTTITDSTTTSTSPTSGLTPTSSSAALEPTAEQRVSAYGGRQTFGRAAASEWVKLRTLRSTWVSMVALLAILIGLGAIAAYVAAGAAPSANTPDAVSTVLVGANFAVLLAGIVGSLAGAREFASRMITVTAAAVPRRWQVVTSKAAALTAIVVPTAIVGVLGAFFVGMATLSAGGGATAALTDDGVLSTVLGMAGYIGAVALVGLALGFLLRSVAASIGVLVGVLVLLPVLASSLLSSSWDSILQFLPSSAASSFTDVMGAGGETLSAGAGALVLVAWVAAVLAAATVVFTRRDV